MQLAEDDNFIAVKLEGLVTVKVAKVHPVLGRLTPEEMLEQFVLLAYLKGKEDMKTILGGQNGN